MAKLLSTSINLEPSRASNLVTDEKNVTSDDKQTAVSPPESMYVSIDAGDDEQFDYCDALDGADMLLDSSTDEDPDNKEISDPFVNEEAKQNDFLSLLTGWAIKFHIPHVALSALLHIIRLYLTFLPTDARTLLHTCHKVNVVDKCNGSFVYFGVKAGIERSLRIYKPTIAGDVIWLDVGTDGIPIQKSSNNQFWPILAKFGGLPPFIVALYYGTTKPKSVHEYLREFVEEMKSISEIGFLVDAKRYFAKIRVFIADAPARAFLKCIKLHNSYDSCERCTVHGLHFNDRVVYNEMDAELRTDRGFAENRYPEHQVDISPLNDICQELVSSFSLDYMHLVCLGVVRRMVNFWKRGPKKCKLGTRCLDTISDDLVNLRPFIPNDFARKPRSLKELDRFKATEFRTLLLYTGPVVLMTSLSSPMYINFMSLSVAMRILLSPKYCVLYCDYARQLLRYFVSHCEAIYDKIMLVYNVHGLLHLADDVEKHKCSLDKVSAFPFENYMQTIKRYVRSPTHPLVQVANRLHEADAAASNRTVKEGTYGKSENKERIFSTAQRDNCYLLHSGDFIFIKEVHRDSGRVTLMSELCPAGQTTSLFSKPCDSKLLHIACITQDQTFDRVMKEPREIDSKCLCLPRRGHGYVLIPMIDDSY